MSALTPQQMRAQADTTSSVAEGLEHFADRVALRRSATALRAAADRIEAVREWAELELEGEQPNEYQRGYQMAAAHARRFILAADEFATAPAAEV